MVSRYVTACIAARSRLDLGALSRNNRTVRTPPTIVVAMFSPEAPRTLYVCIYDAISYRMFYWQHINYLVLIRQSIKPSTIGEEPHLWPTLLHITKQWHCTRGDSANYGLPSTISSNWGSPSGRCPKSRRREYGCMWSTRLTVSSRVSIEISKWDLNMIHVRKV